MGMDSPGPGERLRALRKTWDVSRNHLAELSGVNQCVISRLERGAADARWEIWKRLFSALGYDIAMTVTAEEYGEDDLEDFIRHGIRVRRDRMEAGRLRRW
jgi:predicted transcriptional regulator